MARIKGLLAQSAERSILDEKISKMRGLPSDEMTKAIRSLPTHPTFKSASQADKAGFVWLQMHATDGHTKHDRDAMLYGDLTTGTIYRFPSR